MVTRVTGRKIASLRHTNYTVEYEKKGLSQYDDKRYYLNKYDSLAHGHYKITEINNCKNNDCVQSKCKGKCIRTSYNTLDPKFNGNYL
jgi:hypothetical protein